MYNILKKARENCDIFNPSFIYYINCCTKHINLLFNNINSSKDSIIFDISKGIEIDYIPFWLFALRNLSSLNCIGIDINLYDKNLENDIIEKIKNL